MKTGPVIIILASLAAAAMAAPTHGDSPSRSALLDDVDKDSKRRQACSRQIKWEAGGCETDWNEHCQQHCEASGIGRGCCAGTVNNHIESSGCFPGWNVCRCTCAAN
ncbi:uncharacterized protein B0T15DRAFT_572621 [Chaetomium strumarium]|uniref:Uncharacterized protein n=1 Tax=Chaetomium strumarium TaxID=1170767 RepID=A0AAJ0GYE2_9PEZI|nr:hypothetical protein B0T15DRAFT_572621 [Chaetomium strumarium]